MIWIESRSPPVGTATHPYRVYWQTLTLRNALIERALGHFGVNVCRKSAMTEASINLAGNRRAETE